MKRTLAAAIGAAAMLAFAVPAAQADSISGVEGARAKERQGRYLDRGEREQLRRYGSNDEYGWRPGYRAYDEDYDDYDDDDGPGGGVSVYVGPGGVGVYGD